MPIWVIADYNSHATTFKPTHKFRTLPHFRRFIISDYRSENFPPSDIKRHSFRILRAFLVGQIPAALNCPAGTSFKIPAGLVHDPARGKMEDYVCVGGADRRKIWRRRLGPEHYSRVWSIVWFTSLAFQMINWNNFTPPRLKIRCIRGIFYEVVLGAGLRIKLQPESGYMIKVEH